jgi:membrane protein
MATTAYGVTLGVDGFETATILWEGADGRTRIVATRFEIRCAPSVAREFSPSRKPMTKLTGARWGQLITNTATEWMNANPFRLAAALAYYKLFSMAPLQVVAVGIAGLAFGEEAARGQVFGPLQSILGPKSADIVQNAFGAASVKSSGILASAIGVVTLLVGASAVFSELQDALNTIWEAKPAASVGIRRFLQKRLLSLSMVVVIGFLLLVSLALSAILNAVGGHFGHVLPVPTWVLETANFALSFGVTTLLFAAMFKVLPDIDNAWKDVWIGAAFTAALFTFGKSLIGSYIGRMALDSTYGTAASLLVVLVWVYYSSLIFFFGAEFTHVYAQTHGSQAQRDEPRRGLSEPARTPRTA